MSSLPKHKLSESAIKAWRLSTTIFCFVALLIPLGYWVFNIFGPGRESFSPWVIGAFAAVFVVASGLIVFFLPEIRWQHWYYEVDQHEIDLQSGIIVVSRTLVPVKRVQHVDTRQGPILRSYGLADVTISTAATTHRIPALDKETAEIVRNQISKFARLAKEDV